MVVCSHPTLAWLFAAISWVAFAPEGMELRVGASGLALLHLPGLLMPDVPLSVGSSECGEESGKVGWGSREELLAGPQEGPVFPARLQRLPGEEAVSPTAGEVATRTPVLLLFRWLHEVSPSRP